LAQIASCPAVLTFSAISGAAAPGFGFNPLSVLRTIINSAMLNYRRLRPVAQVKADLLQGLSSLAANSDPDWIWRMLAKRGEVTKLPRGRGGVITFPDSVAMLIAVVVDDVDLVPIFRNLRRSRHHGHGEFPKELPFLKDPDLTFGRALEELVAAFMRSDGSAYLRRLASDHLDDEQAAEVQKLFAAGDTHGAAQLVFKVVRAVIDLEQVWIHITFRLPWFSASISAGRTGVNYMPEELWRSDFSVHADDLDEAAVARKGKDEEPRTEITVTNRPLAALGAALAR
jgi:hypothetical protein